MIYCLLISSHHEYSCSWNTAINNQIILCWFQTRDRTLHHPRIDSPPSSSSSSESSMASSSINWNIKCTIRNLTCMKKKMILKKNHKHYRKKEKQYTCVYNHWFTLLSMISWNPEKTTDLPQVWQTLSHNVVSSTPCHEWDLNSQC